MPIIIVLAGTAQTAKAKNNENGSNARIPRVEVVLGFACDRAEDNIQQISVCHKSREEI